MDEYTNRGGPPGGEGVVVGPLEAGTAVCVWNHFLDGWTGGFAVAGIEDGGYRLTRRSDGHIFDDVFAFDAVIPERRRAQVPGFVGTEHDHRLKKTTSARGSNGSRREPFLR